MRCLGRAYACHSGGFACSDRNRHKPCAYAYAFLHSGAYAYACLAVALFRTAA